MKKIIVLLLFCIISPMIFGDIILQTSTENPSVNTPFILQVTFSNESKKDYNLTGMENFQIISRSSQSSYSIVNGKKSSSKADVYQVIPLKKGKVEMQVKTTDGKTTSNKLTLNVGEGSTQAVQSVSKNVTFQTNLKNKSSYYFGEKIPFYERFLTTVQINSLGYVNPPAFNDFSSKDMTPVDSNGQYQQKYFTDKNGNRGIEIITYQGVLMPDSSGEKTINPGRIGYTEALQDDFFFSRSSNTKYAGGGTININILPLPQERPVGFQNVVGTPKIDFSWNKDKINYGDSVVLSINISGSVNLDTLDKIFTGELPDFNIFENVKGFNEGISNGKYYAVKNFEVAFIPKKTGTLKTPEVKIPYFNTQTKKFEELTIPSKTITVEGSQTSGTIQQNIPGGNSSSTIAPVNNSNNAPQEEIKITSVGENRNQLFNNKVIIGLIVLVIVEGGVIIYLLFTKNKKHDKFDLSDLANTKNNKDFYDAYCSFMKDKFKFSPKVHLDDRLVRLGFSDEFIRLNNEIENAYFSDTPIDIKDTVKKIKKELKNLE